MQPDEDDRRDVGSVRQEDRHAFLDAFTGDRFAVADLLFDLGDFDHADLGHIDVEHLARVVIDQLFDLADRELHAGFHTFAMRS